MIQLKSKDEIEKIRAAGKIVEEIFASLKSAIKPGVSTLELDILAREIVNKHNAISPTIGYGEPPFPAAICASIDEEIVHGIPSDNRRLEEGQIITADVVVGLNGWMADAARTFPVGDISEEKAALIEAAEACFWAGVEQAKVGNRVGDISAAVQAYAEGHGYSVIRELTGHGIGRSMHESPDVPNFGTAGRGPRLEDGMVICIEPMIAIGKRHVTMYSDQWTIAMRDLKPSAHYENTIAITNDGPVILTLSE